MRNIRFQIFLLENFHFLGGKIFRIFEYTECVRNGYSYGLLNVIVT